MNAKVKSIARKIPGFGSLIAKIELLEQDIRDCRVQNAVLARENIGLRLKLKKINGEKVNVVFVCHRPAVWEALHSVYDALAGDPRFDVKIVAIPNKKELPGLWLNHEEYTSEGAERFWKEYGCINGYNYETKEWLDLRTLNPDYVFFQQPYNVARPPLYQSGVVSKYAKILYVAYFVPNSFDAIYDDCAPLDFLRDVSFYFAQREDDAAHMRERLAKAGGLTKTVTSGNPRYDRIERYEGAKSEIWTGEDTFRILWTPRWTTNEGNCFFFAYKDFLLDYPLRREGVELTFRPHPQAFAEWKAMGQMTEVEEQALRGKCTGRLHLDESPDYYGVSFSSDCLVTDKSSMLTDYFFTGKPIIYCRKDHPNGEITPELDEGVYSVYTREELEKTLEALRQGDDPKKGIRERVRSTYLKPKKGKAADVIRDTLAADALGET